MKTNISLLKFRLKVIRIFLVLPFILAGISFANAQNDSSKYFAGYAQVCGKVYGGNVNHVTTKDDIILYIEDTTNSQKFSIIFPYETRLKMSYDPEKKLVNRQVCITGDAEHSEEGMSIVIHSEDQIKIE